MDDGGSDLALDVVSDDGKAGGVEPAAQSGSEAMNTGIALTKATPASRRPRRRALGLFGPDRQVTDQDVGPGVLECLHHVDRFGG